MSVSNSERAEIARYLSQDIDGLRDELGRHVQTEVRHSPITPYLADLRRAICEDWNWCRRKNDPALADPQRCTEEVMIALILAHVRLPFPLTLTASFLVKVGLDELCGLD